jgi:hypothetical protein
MMKSTDAIVSLFVMVEWVLAEMMSDGDDGVMLSVYAPAPTAEISSSKENEQLLRA